MNGQVIRTTLFILALLLPAAIAEAQIVSPVINYQGRAQDASGAPVTGERAMIMRIYDAQGGGTALFSENHPSVTFNANGIFTAVIGGNTPGGIPQTIGFDQPRWLGVTIEGFNNGNELPRLRFYGTAYAFEANHAFETDHADSAERSGTAVSAVSATTAETATTADSAGVAGFADSSAAAGIADFAFDALFADTAFTAEELLLPAILENHSSTPVLDVRNGSGPGIRVGGSPYAVISSGTDSTSKHFVAGEVAGNTGTPNPGSIYRDNAPIAWAQIAGDGTIISDFGILRVSHTPNDPGAYLITLDNPVAGGGKTNPEYSVIVTPRYDNRIGLVFAFWNYASDQNGTSAQTFEVLIGDFESGVDNDFSVVVFGRPSK